jgi:hypothetical protein
MEPVSRARGRSPSWIWITAGPMLAVVSPIAGDAARALWPEAARMNAAIARAGRDII